MKKTCYHSNTNYNLCSYINIMDKKNFNKYIEID